MKKAIIRSLYIFLFLIFSQSVFAIEVEHIEAKSIEKPVENAQLNPYENGIEIPNPFEKKPVVEKVEVQKQKSEISLNSDEVFYNQETNEIEAIGNVSIIAKPDNTKITAKRAVFSRPNNTIKLFGDVVLHKDGGKVSGDYMSINLLDENVLIDEPIANFSNFKIKAKEGHAYANKIVAIDGEVKLPPNINSVVESHGFGRFHDEEIFTDLIKPGDLSRKRSEDFKIKTSEIIITPEQDHDVVTFKNADMYYKKFKLVTASDISIYTDKEQNYVEANVPEMGSIADFGTYFGLGYVAKAPYGGTIKLVPALVEDDGLGFGGIVRLRSKRNKTQAAWASSSENLVIRGKYQFNKNLWIDYGRHAYFDEWYFGHRRPGYIGQLVYNNDYDVEDLKLNFAHRISAGYVAEYDLDNQEHAMGTMRFRYQSEISKQIFQKGDLEQDAWIQLYGVARAAATLYGNGDSVGFAGIGPYVKSRVKRWASTIGVTFNGIGGDTPFLFDDYRYGKLTFHVNESIRLNKYLSVGYRGMITPLKDNYNEKMITENRLYVLAGPEDTKIMFAYDTVRKRSTFDFMFLLGSNEETIARFDKLTIEDPTKASKKRDRFENIKFIKLKVPKEEI